MFMLAVVFDQFTLTKLLRPNLPHFLSQVFMGIFLSDARNCRVECQKIRLIRRTTRKRNSRLSDVPVYTQNGARTFRTLDSGRDRRTNIGRWITTRPCGTGLTKKLAGWIMNRCGCELTVGRTATEGTGASATRIKLKIAIGAPRGVQLYTFDCRQNMWRSRLATKRPDVGDLIGGRRYRRGAILPLYIYAVRREHGTERSTGNYSV